MENEQQPEPHSFTEEREMYGERARVAGKKGGAINNPESKTPDELEDKVTNSLAIDGLEAAVKAAGQESGATKQGDAALETDQDGTTSPNAYFAPDKAKAREAGRKGGDSPNLHRRRRT
jgi:general stress protein YciG